MRRGVPVITVLQGWEPGREQRGGRFLPLPHPRTVAALRSIESVAALHPADPPEAVADYTVIWECRGNPSAAA